MDHLTPERRSANMSAVKCRNTQPEMLVRTLSHRMGYRFRLHYSALPGKPDLAFPARRKAIFVHGCFWHGHTCKRGTRPKTRADFWRRKITGNAARDARQIAMLKAAGWRSLVVWECETKKAERLCARLRLFLG
jgi:DNA mismatch endonuclease (patch repair protein)